MAKICRANLEFKKHLKGDAKELNELSKGVKEMKKDDKKAKRKIKKK